MAGRMIHEMGQIAGKGLAALIFLECIHRKFFVKCKQLQPPLQQSIRRTSRERELSPAISAVFVMGYSYLRESMGSAVAALRDL